MKTIKIPVVLLSLMAAIGLAGAARAATDCYTNTVYFGWEGCQPIVDDYDGDGLDDIAVYDTDSAIWYIWQSTNDVLRTGQWGAANCVPVAGDYDGDGMVDLAVYQPATGKWWIYSLGAATVLVDGGCWGSSDCVPIPADYNGDGADDVAVYETSTRKWYIYSVKDSATLLYDAVWGADGVTPVPADYDGDGKADPALYQESSDTWGALLSGSDYQLFTLSLGAMGYVPVPADYDGNGRAESAIYSAEAGKYYLWLTTNATLLEFNVPTGGVPCPGRFYLPDVYTMAIFQTNVTAGHGVKANSGGRFDIIIPAGSSAISDGIMDSFAAVSTVTGPFSQAISIINGGMSILQTIGVMSSPEQEILDMLNQMDKKLDEINRKLDIIDQKIDNLRGIIVMKFEDIKEAIKWMPLSAKITTIKGAYDTMRPMVSTNYVATKSFAVRQAAMSTIVNYLKDVKIQQVTQELAINLMEEVESTGRGFLDIYTDYLINNHLKQGQSLLYCYLNLEYLFGRVLTYEYKGAQLTMELLTQTISTNAAIEWRDSIFLGGQYGIAAQMGKFNECVHRMVDLPIDTGLYVMCPPTNRPFLPADALAIYSRANFIAAYCSTNYYHGLAGRLIGEPGRIAEYGRQGQVRANNLPLPLMRPVARAVPVMTSPYTSTPAWMVYMEYSPSSYQLSATNQMAFDVFALTNAAAGDYRITVAGARESETAQTVAVQWRSNDYVTVVSPGASNSVPYGYFIVPVRHYVGQHPGNVIFETPTIHYGTDPDHTSSMKFEFLGDCTVTGIVQAAYVEYPEGHYFGSGFDCWWEHSLAISLLRAPAMNDRTVGLYGQSRVLWHGDHRESKVFHAIGIGIDIQNYVAKADIVYTEEESRDWHTFYGAGSVTGKVAATRQYIPVFSSVRGHAEIQPHGTLSETAWTDRLILYLP